MLMLAADLLPEGVGEVVEVVGEGEVPLGLTAVSQ